MDKKFLRAYLYITVILLIGAFVFGGLYYKQDRFITPEGEVLKSHRSPTSYENLIRVQHRPQSEPNAPVKKLIGGICASLLLGYLLVICHKKFMRDSKAESVSLANLLQKISSESGRTEYELFVIASKDWSISEARIDAHFKEFMGAGILPYYVKDFVRKNYDYIDKSLKKEEKIEPTSPWDLVKALLIFPGGILIPYFLLIIFRPDIFTY